MSSTRTARLAGEKLRGQAGCGQRLVQWAWWMGQELTKRGWGQSPGNQARMPQVKVGLTSTVGRGQEPGTRSAEWRSQATCRDLLGSSEVKGLMEPDQEEGGEGLAESVATWPLLPGGASFLLQLHPRDPPALRESRSGPARQLHFAFVPHGTRCRKPLCPQQR